MTSFDNPFAPRTNRLQARSAEIKTWVREILGLPAETPVTVSELACRDEGCPDIETVIGVLEPGTPMRVFRVHLAMQDVSRDAVGDALANRSEQ